MERLSHRETDEALVIGLSGEIIMDHVAELKADLTPMIEHCAKAQVVFDLGQVNFMDSSGVGLLIGLRRLCQDRGKAFCATNPAPPIRKLLTMLRLTQYFSVPPSPADAPPA